MRFILAAMLLGIASAAAGAGNVSAGRDLFAVCAGCHAFDGRGNRNIRAPGLAGLEPWYVVRQLEHFRSGIRGTSERDPYGMQMASMALALSDQRAAEDVAAYIAQLPAPRRDATVRGDSARGRDRYSACSACHGAQAEGSQDLGAPQLAGLDDWYIVAQLELFKTGLRGAHPDDAYGQQMRAFASLLDDQQALLDVAAYIGTLGDRGDARRAGSRR